MHVLLDLWGTVLDSARMHAAYGPRLAEILVSRIGGDIDTWTRAHDAVWPWYAVRAAQTDWTRGDYLGQVAALDSEYAERILAAGGTAWRPPDPVAFWAEVEREIMASVDAQFPDARSAVERMRSAGHRVYVVTSATDSNARGSLEGAGCLDAFDRVFTGSLLNLHKSSVPYWARILEEVRAPAESCLLVDDRIDYLESAAAAGIPVVLLDRKGAHPPESLPPFVRATLRGLSGLPHLVELFATGKAP